MEPLPKERSDGRSRRGPAASSGPGRNGAAPEGAERPAWNGPPVTPPECRNGAAPEGAERLDEQGGPLGDDLAAMEPLPKERSDLRRTAWTGRPTSWPQWSRSRRSGATGVFPRPASAQHAPQWSRSRRSGATWASAVLSEEDQKPQWSRSRRSGATLDNGETSGLLLLGRNGAAPEGAERPRGQTDTNGRPLLPQWNRSRRSGATRAKRLRHAGHSLAAMEPLPKERSDIAAARGH